MPKARCVQRAPPHPAAQWHLACPSATEQTAPFMQAIAEQRSLSLSLALALACALAAAAAARRVVVGLVAETDETAHAVANSATAAVSANDCERERTAGARAGIVSKRRGGRAKRGGTRRLLPIRRGRTAGKGTERAGGGRGTANAGRRPIGLCTQRKGEQTDRQ
jgi:hypothetical protein